MDGRRYGGAVVVVALLGLLGGCGGGDDAVGTDGAPSADGSSGAEALAVVTVDGQAYASLPPSDYEGGACRINDADRPGRDFVAYFAESGERVELSFLSGPDIEGSSDDVFRGSLGIGGTQEWSFESLDPWPWTDSDGSTLTGSFTMEERDGNPAEVTFDITCP